MEISFVSSALSFENREIPSSANCAAFNLGSQHDCGEEKVVNVTQRRRRRDRVKWHLIHVEKILAFDFHSSFTLSSIRQRHQTTNVKGKRYFISASLLAFYDLAALFYGLVEDH